ncbi:ATPase [Thalassococcus sp. CAU 1522]|uniref:ATPase n=1 Tax=Thalassococcus arenae TaxID=2851652 RepID=A0ABS6N791_9RHOB|nr:ATP12 family protein [Thalassococcus arenae]MBV2359875.1 ATPase [Thalassococcus arenae]
MSEWAARRFWKTASVAEAEGGHTVLLDGRPVRTPAKAPLIVPTHALAREVAAEWDAQDSLIQPLTMPYTRSANAAIDKVAAQFDEVADMLAAYGDSDLLCYRADHPEELLRRQQQAWDPVLDWADRALNARLVPRTGVIHAPQDQNALKHLRDEVHALDRFALTALHDLVTLSGSLVLALAVLRQALSADDAWQKSRIDETWQAEQWGRDDEAEEAAEVKREAFLHAAKLHELSRNPIG